MNIASIPIHQTTVKLCGMIYLIPEYTMVTRDQPISPCLQRCPGKLHTQLSQFAWRLAYTATSTGEKSGAVYRKTPKNTKKNGGSHR